MGVSNFWIKYIRSAIAVVWILNGLPAVPVGAQPLRGAVVHVHHGVDSPVAALQIFEKAKKQVTEIYDAISVSLIWADGSTTANHTGAIHLVVEVLSDEQTARFLRDNRQLPKTVLGVAPSGTGRAYIFLDRVLRRARKDETYPHRVLGVVLAHEIGHLLLPTQRHSDTGLMRRSMNYQSTELPAFTDAEAESIRMLLTGERRTN